MLDCAAGSLGDLACAFDRTDADVFACGACAFACGSYRFDGVKGSKIASGFARASGRRADASSCTLADIAGAAADIATGTAAWALGGNSLLRGGVGLGSSGLRLSGCCCGHGV